MRINSNSTKRSSKNLKSKEHAANKVRKSFEELYERDKATDAFIIRTAIEKYADVFNELDPAPFKKRDLDQDLRDFLEDCSGDIPLKHNIALHFKVLNEKRNIDKEEKIKQGLKTYFSFVKELLHKKIKRSNKKIAFYAIASLFLLAVSLSLHNILSDNVFFTTLVEVLNIGGWVFLWEAISTFAFRNRDVKNNYKQYKRLNEAQIIFETTQTN